MGLFQNIARSIEAGKLEAHQDMQKAEENRRWCLSEAADKRRNAAAAREAGDLEEAEKYDARADSWERSASRY